MWQRPCVHQHRVNYRAEVTLDRANVIGGIVAVRLARLREQVQHQYAPAATGSERRPHSFPEQACDHAGVQAPGTEDDEVRLGHRFERGSCCAHRPVQAQSSDPTLGGGNGRFTPDDAAIRELRHQIDAPNGRRKDVALRAEQPRRGLHRGIEVAEALGQGREDQVADRVPPETSGTGEAMLEDAGEWVLLRR